MKIEFNTTIIAPASATGGAISVLRVSGREAHKLVNSIFRPANKDSLQKAAKEGFRIVYGEIMDGDSIVDDVLVSYFVAPDSYTGEDSAEISCHASPYVVRRILEMLVEGGGSPARPGEFTQRAFMNGKMDLSQAEAVADLISSETEASHRLAIEQMRGGYSDEINRLREKMLHFASMIELELDFGEEDVEFASRKELKNMVEEIKGYTDSLRDSFRYGNAIKNGVPVAIVGRPNTGKSTLLNSLLKDERAIVSEIPGTTRDFIEDTVVIDGILFRFIDTAGLRETADVIENLGIRRTYQKIGQSSIVLLMAEAGDDPHTINESVKRVNEQIGDSTRDLVLILNKRDQAEWDAVTDLLDSAKIEKGRKVAISASTGEGLNELTDILGSIVRKGVDNTGSVIVTNLRHFEALGKCSGSLSRVLEGLEGGIPEDLVAMDLRQAIHYLGEITGQISTDEILGNIFKNFCIGK